MSAVYLRTRLLYRTSVREPVEKFQIQVFRRPYLYFQCQKYDQWSFFQGNLASIVIQICLLFFTPRVPSLLCENELSHTAWFSNS